MHLTASGCIFPSRLLVTEVHSPVQRFEGGKGAEKHTQGEQKKVYFCAFSCPACPSLWCCSLSPTFAAAHMDILLLVYLLSVFAEGACIMLFPSCHIQIAWGRPRSWQQWRDRPVSHSQYCMTCNWQIQPNGRAGPEFWHVPSFMVYNSDGKHLACQVC